MYKICHTILTIWHIAWSSIKSRNFSWQDERWYTMTLIVGTLALLSWKNPQLKKKKGIVVEHLDIMEWISTIYSRKKYAAISTSKSNRGEHCTVEAVCCCRLAETRMLNHYIPVWEVTLVVVIRNCQFYPPITHLIAFNMPMNLNRAHMISALDFVKIIGKIWYRWGVNFSGIAKREIEGEMSGM